MAAGGVTTAAVATVGRRLHTWGVPGFRTGTLWKQVAGGLGYAAIVLLALLTLRAPVATAFFLAGALGVVALAANYQGVRARVGRQALWLGPTAFIIGFVALVAGMPQAPETPEVAAQRQARAAAQAAHKEASAQATAAAQAGRAQLQEAAKAEAVQLLAAAQAKRSEGDLGIAVELGKQAQAKAPDLAEIRAFMGEVAPQATALARDAQAQATAAVRAQAEANAQATAQAMAAATTAALTGRVGQRREASGIALTVNTVAKVPAFSQFLRAAANKTYLNLDVTIETTSRDTAPYNPLYFKVKDADGVEYTTAFGGDDRALKGGSLPRGERVRGTVPFEVPVAARGFVMTYEPVVILGGYQPIRVALE